MSTKTEEKSRSHRRYNLMNAKALLWSLMACSVFHIEIRPSRGEGTISRGIPREVTSREVDLQELMLEEVFPRSYRFPGYPMVGDVMVGFIYWSNSSPIFQFIPKIPTVAAKRHPSLCEVFAWPLYPTPRTTVYWIFFLKKKAQFVSPTNRNHNTLYLIADWANQLHWLTG